MSSEKNKAGIFSVNKKGTFVKQKFLFVYPSRRLGISSRASGYFLRYPLIRRLLYDCVGFYILYFRVSQSRTVAIE